MEKFPPFEHSHFILPLYLFPHQSNFYFKRLKVHLNTTLCDFMDVALAGYSFFRDKKTIFKNALEYIYSVSFGQC